MTRTFVAETADGLGWPWWTRKIVDCTVNNPSTFCHKGASINIFFLVQICCGNWAVLDLCQKFYPGFYLNHVVPECEVSEDHTRESGGNRGHIIQWCQNLNTLQGPSKKNMKLKYCTDYNIYMYQVMKITKPWALNKGAYEVFSAYYLMIHDCISVLVSLSSLIIQSLFYIYI